MMGAQTSGCTHFGSVPEVIKSLLAPYEFTLFLHCICGSSSPATRGWEVLRNSMLNPLYTMLFVSKACFPSRSGLRSLGITNSATKENLFKAYARKERLIQGNFHRCTLQQHAHTPKHTHIYTNTHITIQIHLHSMNHIYRKSRTGEGCLQFSLLGKFRNSSSRLKISEFFSSLFHKSLSPYLLYRWVTSSEHTTLKGQQQMSQCPVASQHSR